MARLMVPLHLLPLLVTRRWDRLMTTSRQLPLLFRATVPCRLGYPLTPDSLLSMNCVGGLTPLCELEVPLNVRLRYVLRNALSRRSMKTFVPLVILLLWCGPDSMHMALLCRITCPGLTSCGLEGSRPTWVSMPGLVRTSNVPPMLNYLDFPRCGLMRGRVPNAVV